MGFLGSLTDFILPPTCAACGAFCERDGLCSACAGGLVLLRSPLCDRCGIALHGAPGDDVCGACLVAPPRYDRARAVFAYEGTGDRAKTLAALLYRYKYG